MVLFEQLKSVFSLFPRYYLLEILWAVMHTSTELVKTGQGKVLSSSWQTKGWQQNEDPLTDQFHTSLFGV